MPKNVRDVGAETFLNAIFSVSQMVAKTWPTGLPSRVLKNDFLGKAKGLTVLPEQKYAH